MEIDMKCCKDVCRLCVLGSHGNWFCSLVGQSFTFPDTCKAKVTDEDVAAAKREVELNKEVFEITLKTVSSSLVNAIRCSGKPRQKQALKDLQLKNRVRLEKRKVYQEATPEERTGMRKKCDKCFILKGAFKFCDRCSFYNREHVSVSQKQTLKNFQEKNADIFARSADELKSSSMYKRALPEEREAMLERHYKLELARIKSKLTRANHEVVSLNGCNRKLEQKVATLEERLCSRKKTLNADLVAVNESLAEENSKMIKQLNSMNELAGKLRLLDRGEPYQEGDLHQIVAHDEWEWEWEWEWKCLDDLAGTPHDGEDIVARRISKDARKQQESQCCGDCQVLLQQIDDMKRYLEKAKEEAYYHRERRKAILQENKELFDEIESKGNELEDLRKEIKALKACNDKLREQVCGKWRLLEDKESIQGEDEIARWCNPGLVEWVPINMIGPILLDSLLDRKQVIRRKITL